MNKIDTIKKYIKDIENNQEDGLIKLFNELNNTNYSKAITIIDGYRCLFHFNQEDEDLNELKNTYKIDKVIIVLDDSDVIKNNEYVYIFKSNIKESLNILLLEEEQNILTCPFCGGKNLQKNKFFTNIFSSIKDDYSASIEFIKDQYNFYLEHGISFKCNDCGKTFNYDNKDNIIYKTRIDKESYISQMKDIMNDNLLELLLKEKENVKYYYQEEVDYFKTLKIK